MNNLVIHFADAELGDFRWALLDSEANSAKLAWRPGTQSDLASISAEHRDPVILLIPQQCVYLSRVELPQKASRQVLSAIEFQVEDQLAQDIETQHFALGDTSANPISIAVVEKAIMQRCLSLARTHGLRLSQVLPELFLCPWNGSGVHMIEGYDGYLLRYGDYQGLKCRAPALAAMLALIRRETEFDTLAYYADESESAGLPEIDGIAIERQALDAQPCGLLGGPVIELQQREFAPASAWKAVAKAWKWIALLLGALLTVAAFNKAIALQQLEEELSTIRQQQYQLLKDYLPANTGADANLKKLLVDRLKQEQLNQAQQGFMQLLVDFSQARVEFTAVQVTRIGYQNKRLNIDISSAQLSDIEALHRAMVKKGVSAQLENLSIKPDIISARLVLLGDQNG